MQQFWKSKFINVTGNLKIISNWKSIRTKTASCFRRGSKWLRVLDFTQSGWGDWQPLLIELKRAHFILILLEERIASPEGSLLLLPSLNLSSGLGVYICHMKWVYLTEQAHCRNNVMAGKAILLPGKIILSWRLQQVVTYDLVLAQDKVTDAKALRKSVSRGKVLLPSSPHPSPWAHKKQALNEKLVPEGRNMPWSHHHPYWSRNVSNREPGALDAQAWPETCEEDCSAVKGTKGSSGKVNQRNWKTLSYTAASNPSC